MTALLVRGALIAVHVLAAVAMGARIERSPVYGALGALGVVAFAGVENALSTAVERWVHLPGFVGAAVAGVLVAAGLVPVRRGIEGWVKRRRTLLGLPVSSSRQTWQVGF